MRHPLQIIISMGQLYGVVLYYATSMFDHYFYDKAYSRPEAYYFWGYYFLTNFFWVLIPGRMSYCHCVVRSPANHYFVELIYNSSRAIAGAFRALDKMKVSLQNGTDEIKKTK